MKCSPFGRREQLYTIQCTENIERWLWNLFLFSCSHNNQMKQHLKDRDEIRDDWRWNRTRHIRHVVLKYINIVLQLPPGGLFILFLSLKGYTCPNYSQAKYQPSTTLQSHNHIICLLGSQVYITPTGTVWSKCTKWVGIKHYFLQKLYLFRNFVNVGIMNISQITFSVASWSLTDSFSHKTRFIQNCIQPLPCIRQQLVCFGDHVLSFVNVIMEVFIHNYNLGALKVSLTSDAVVVQISLPVIE